MPKQTSTEDMLKSGVLRRGDDPALDIRRLPIGIAAIDELLGGGLPLGRCIELYGPESTGKTLMAQYMVAAVQKSSKPNALHMDLERCYDKEWWRQSGVDVEKLIVSSPATAEEAIDIMVNVLFNDDTFGIFVVDSIPAMIPAPIADPERSAEDKTVGLSAKLVTLMYYKMVHQIAEKGAILLVTNQMRDNIGGHDELAVLPGGKAQRHYNQIILRTRREEWIKEGGKPIGYKMNLISKKNKTCAVPDGTEITIPILASSQIDMLTAWLEFAIEKKIIDKRGAYFYYANKNFQGMQNLRQFFIDTPAEKENLERELLLV